MRKRLLVLFLLCLPLAAFGQTSVYKGSYRALSINFLTDDKFEANFEVGDDLAIAGKILLGEQKTPVENALAGKVDAKGKFEAQTTGADGTIYGIRGSLPNASGRLMIQFFKKSVVSSKGKKQVSEFEVMGMIERQKSVSNAAETIFPDTGKTYLKIEYANSFFGSVWENMSVKSSDETKNTGKTYRTLELETADADSRHSLRFVLPLEADKKEWIAESGKGWSIFYRQNKGSEKKLFFVTKSGSILLLSEDERETVWLVKDIVLRNALDTETVKLTGYIHIPK